MQMLQSSKKVRSELHFKLCIKNVVIAKTETGKTYVC